jgi:hypothetical protein
MLPLSWLASGESWRQSSWHQSAGTAEFSFDRRRASGATKFEVYADLLQDNSPLSALSEAVLSLMALEKGPARRLLLYLASESKILARHSKSGTGRPNRLANATLGLSKVAAVPLDSVAIEWPSLKLPLKRPG